MGRVIEVAAETSLMRGGGVDAAELPNHARRGTLSGEAAADTGSDDDIGGGGGGGDDDRDRVGTYFPVGGCHGAGGANKTGEAPGWPTTLSRTASLRCVSSASSDVSDASLRGTLIAKVEWSEI